MENKENVCNNWKKIKRDIHRERKPDKDEKTREFKKKKTAKKNEGVKERKSILTFAINNEEGKGTKAE